MSSALDPYQLKYEGLNYLQRYAGNQWTDHNLHDPGIIILEQLCYALADLNYRTSFDMADLLERPAPPADQPFFSQRSIFHTRPLTAIDYRKLLLDVKGVRNAWVIPGNLRHPLYYNNTYSKLTFDTLYDPSRQEAQNALQQLKVHGLFDVLLAFDFDEEGTDLNSNKLLEKIGDDELLVAEFPRWDNTEVIWEDPDSIWNNLVSVKWFQQEEFLYYHQLSDERKTIAKDLIFIKLIPKYQSMISKAHEIRDEVTRLLHANRNLGQDFAEIKAVKSEDIGFTAEIEINGDVLPEEIFAELLASLNDYLAPPTRFYSLPDLLGKGFAPEDIFNGVPLTHGFLLNEELPAQLPNLRTSDLINIMMDLPGIKAVKNFHAASYPEGVLFRSAQRWCLRLNPDLNYCPRIAPEYVQISFFVDGMPVLFKLDEALNRFRNKQAERTAKKYPQIVQTSRIPEGGTFRELDQHYSIQKEFPMNFSIGEEGLATDVSVARRSQAHQLKSYLMVFEQLMANYSSQLSSIPELFSLNENVSHTMYGQLPADVPGLQHLLIRLSSAEDQELAVQQMKMALQDMLETKDQFVMRRNRFLNHLMARFGEDINTHPLIKSRHAEDDGLTEIGNKVRLLRNFPEISSHRGAGINYLPKTGFWNADALAGFQKRVYLLAGIKDLKRKILATEAGTDAEGFHVVEHILLRPQTNDIVDGLVVKYPLLPIFPDPEDYWMNDPYSSIISIVIPDWPDRFKDQEFHDYLEKLIHLQAPAHLHVIIHWINKDQMNEFENAYAAWLQLLPHSFIRKTEYLKALSEIINVMLPWLKEEKLEFPDPVIPENSNPVVNTAWYSTEESAQWRQLEDKSIVQCAFRGHGTPGPAGKGQALVMMEATSEYVEVVRMEFIPGDETFGESGLVFDFVSENNEITFKLLYYSHYQKTMVLAEVIHGYSNVILETKIKDLSGKEVRVEMTTKNGRLKLAQSSPGTIGTEFSVGRAGSTGNNRVGLYTRYTQYTVFTHLEFIDSEYRNILFSRKKAEVEDD